MPKRTNHVSFSSSSEEEKDVAPCQPQPTLTNAQENLDSRRSQASIKDHSASILASNYGNSTSPPVSFSSPSAPLPSSSSSSSSLSSTPSPQQQSPGLRYRPSHSSLGFAHHSPSSTFRSKGWTSGPSASASSLNKKKPTIRYQSAGSPTSSSSSNPGLFPRIRSTSNSNNNNGNSNGASGPGGGSKTSSQILSSHVHFLTQRDAEAQSERGGIAAAEELPAEGSSAVDVAGVADYHEEADDDEEDEYRNETMEEDNKRSSSPDPSAISKKQYQDRRRRLSSRIGMTPSPTKQIWAGNEQYGFFSFGANIPTHFTQV